MKILARIVSVLTIALVSVTFVEAADLQVMFVDSAWNGDKVPEGQHCNLFDGNGSTPPMKVSGIPTGTVAILVEFNDRTYEKLSANGGHGIVGFEHAGGSEAILVAVPGGTNKGLPQGTWLEKKNRAGGMWRSAGYLPPCSGGKGNEYFADVFAVDASGERLAKGTIELGRY